MKFAYLALLGLVSADDRQDFIDAHEDVVAAQDALNADDDNAELQTALADAQTAAGEEYDLANPASTPVPTPVELSSEESLAEANTALEAAQKAVEDNAALEEADQVTGDDLAALETAVTEAQEAVDAAQGVVEQEAADAARLLAIDEDVDVVAAKEVLDAANQAYTDADDDADNAGLKVGEADLQADITAAQEVYDDAVTAAGDAHDLALFCEDEENAEHEDCLETPTPAGSQAPPEDSQQDVDPEDTEPDCEADPDAEGCDVEAEGGNTALIVVLVLAALGGIGGAVYCKTQEKMCFAKKDPEGGQFESLI